MSEIVCGDLREIRKSAKFSRKSNAMIHNFWTVGYQYQRIREKAEEYGIRTRRENERGTSSKCPRCGSKRIVKRGRLFKCVECMLEAHRDAVGSVNIGLAQGYSLREPLTGRWHALCSYHVYEQEPPPLGRGGCQTQSMELRI